MGIKFLVAKAQLERLKNKTDSASYNLEEAPYIFKRVTLIAKSYGKYEEQKKARLSASGKCIGWFWKFFYYFI